MIICSCNVLSEAQILEALQQPPEGRPRSAGEAYRCLGCAPRCGRCVATVRALVAKAHLEHCNVGCPTCPAADAHHAAHEADAVSAGRDDAREAVILIAAE